MIKLEIDDGQEPFGILNGRRMTMVKASIVAEEKKPLEVGDPAPDGLYGMGEVMRKLDQATDHDWIPVGRSGGMVMFSVVLEELPWWVEHFSK